MLEISVTCKITFSANNDIMADLCHEPDRSELRAQFNKSPHANSSMYIFYYGCLIF